MTAQPLTDDQEREQLIEALIADDFEQIKREFYEVGGCKGSPLGSYLECILRNGHGGYENVSTYDLRDEMKIRGLKL